jgi:hypothetical protein
MHLVRHLQQVSEAGCHCYRGEQDAEQEQGLGRRPGFQSKLENSISHCYYGFCLWCCPGQSGSVAAGKGRTRAERESFARKPEQI